VTGNLQEVLDLRRWREAKFDEADRALLGYAEAFTFASHRIRADDLAGLRDVGFTNLQIIEMSLCAGYRHYITRIADATGIDIDAELNISPILVEAYSHPQATMTAGEVKRAGDAECEFTAAVKDGPWVAVAERLYDDPTLGSVWSAWRADYGIVPGLLRALSLRPQAVNQLDSFWRLACFGGSSMGRLREVLLGRTVAARLQSPWLFAIYEEVLQRVIKGTGNVAPITVWQESNLPEQEKAVLFFVEQITDWASGITQEDVNRVREAGLSDPEILDVIVATALLNCLGRMANALGVPQDVVLD